MDFIGILKLSTPIRYQKVKVKGKVKDYPVFEIIVDEELEQGYVLDLDSKNKIIEPLSWQ